MECVPVRVGTNESPLLAISRPMPDHMVVCADEVVAGSLDASREVPYHLRVGADFGLRKHDAELHSVLVISRTTPALAPTARRPADP